MSQRTWQCILLCGLILICPFALATPADTQRPLSATLTSDSTSNCSAEFLASLQGPSLTLYVEQHSIWLTETRGYVFEGTDDVGDCLSTLRRQGFLNATLPVTQLMVKGNQPLVPTSLVNDFLTNLTFLEDLHWESSALPAHDLLNTFEKKHSNARLHLRFSNDRWQNAEFRQLLGTFAGRGTLHSIVAHIGYGDEEEPEHMPALERLVGSASNLKQLSLQLEHYPTCLPASKQPVPFTFDQLQKRQSFPPLETLHLDGYSLGAHADGDGMHEYACIEGDNEDFFSELRKAWIHLVFWVKGRYDAEFDPRREDSEDYWFLRRVRCPMPRSRQIPNVYKWLQHMDWSKLHTLSLHNTQSFTLGALAAHLPNLRDISIANVHVETATSFLDQLPNNLSFLTLIDIKGNLTDPRDILSEPYCLSSLYESIIRNHGTLQNLTIWSHETLFRPSSDVLEGNLDVAIPLPYRNQTSPVSHSPAFNPPSALPALLVPSTYAPDDLAVPKPLEPHPYLSPQQLQQLATLPRLTHLNIDVPRPYNHSLVLTPAYHSAVAALPHLAHLTLHFPSIDTLRKRNGTTRIHHGAWNTNYNPSINIDPQITNLTITELFLSLRQERMNLYSDSSTCFSIDSGSEATCERNNPPNPSGLTTLVVIAGEWDLRYLSGPFGGGPEPMLSGRWLCRVQGIGENNVACEGGNAWPTAYRPPKFLAGR
ncbi:hypothetical protein OHC33_006582 [Knufia fluminis]|uniref:Uncharacterized protein n=1 Tax=Knufia fluminis TaxID=191047 RepID=A0AAN8ILW0_9EURO|nr:hypothetical protein OHC33_006582 [Knufia fluminis]